VDTQIGRILIWNANMTHPCLWHSVFCEQ